MTHDEPLLATSLGLGNSNPLPLPCGFWKVHDALTISGNKKVIPGVIPVALSLFMFRAKLEQMTLNIGPEIFSEIGVALYLGLVNVYLNFHLMIN